MVSAALSFVIFAGALIALAVLVCVLGAIALTVGCAIIYGSYVVLTPVFAALQRWNRKQSRFVVPALWGSLGREFGAWDWEHVWWQIQQRRYHDVPKASQRKRRHQHSAGLRDNASDKKRTESTRARKRKRRNK